MLFEIKHLWWKKYSYRQNLCGYKYKADKVTSHNNGLNFNNSFDYLTVDWFVCIFHDVLMIVYCLLMLFFAMCWFFVLCPKMSCLAEWHLIKWDIQTDYGMYRTLLNCVPWAEHGNFIPLKEQGFTVSHWFSGKEHLGHFFLLSPGWKCLNFQKFKSVDSCSSDRILDLWNPFIADILLL